MKQVYLEIMMSTQSKGEWEWALAELLKLKEEEEFVQTGNGTVAQRLQELEEEE